jgi:hypothetical protein
LAHVDRGGHTRTTGLVGTRRTRRMSGLLARTPTPRPARMELRRDEGAHRGRPACKARAARLQNTRSVRAGRGGRAV